MAACGKGKKGEYFGVWEAIIIRNSAMVLILYKVVFCIITSTHFICRAQEVEIAHLNNIFSQRKTVKLSHEHFRFKSDAFSVPYRQ